MAVIAQLVHSHSCEAVSLEALPYRQGNAGKFSDVNEE